MQQHMDIIMVLAALAVALVGYFLIKMFSANKRRQEQEKCSNHEVEPQIGNVNSLYNDQVLSIKKIDDNQNISQLDKQDLSTEVNSEVGQVYTLHVMAKNGEFFKGYELLQAILSQGLRFGDMNIFHRYQNSNGKGAVLFSLTSAIEPGTFDIHNMGSHVCPGLTLFMQSSSRSNIDIERFELMVTVAQNLARELDGSCQAQNRQPLTEQMIEQYKYQIYNVAKVDEVEELIG